MNNQSIGFRRAVIGVFALALVMPAFSDAARADHRRHGHGYWQNHDHGWALRKRHHRHWRHHHHNTHRYRSGPTVRYSYDSPSAHGTPTVSNNALLGGLIGAALGAATGTQFGKGSGRTVAIIGGGLLGALIGGNLGNSMDQTDRRQVNRALETSRTGSTIVWRNQETGGSYNVTPTRTYQVSGSTYCREFTTWGMVGGYEEKMYGTACRQPDGSWKTVK